jgi:hypothetical protein
MIITFSMKSLFSLMRRSLFNVVHHMTDPDSNSAFIVGNITKPDEIP